MIAFELTEQQRMVRDMVRDFAAKEVHPYVAENDREGRFDPGLQGKMASLGLLGGPIPERYGGGGLDYISWGLTCEELEYVDTSARALVSVQVGLTGLTLLTWGSEEQKQRFLAPQARGEKLACFGLTEPGSGSDAAGMQSTAVREGESYVLNGEKMWSSNGEYADHALVFAYTDRERRYRGMSALLVERDTPGFTTSSIHGKLGVRAGNTAGLSFMDCRVPGNNLLGEEGEGFSIAMFAVDQGRYGVASGATGLIRACLDASVRYARERTAFGRPIGEHQLIKQKIADMSVSLEAARLLYYQAGWLKNRGRPNTRETSMAKWFNSEAAQRAAYDAVQVHGSYGYSSEYPVERYFRNARALTILEGPSEIHTLMQADFALGYREPRPGRCTLPPVEGDA